jgi:hypothetical protein
MQTVYNKIIETFNDHSEVFSDRNLPGIKMIDIHMGQPDDPEGWDVFCPAIFIDWRIAPGSEGEGDTLALDFHVLQEPGTGTENFNERLPEGLEYMEILKAVKSLINRLRAENTTPLKYAGERPAITPFFKYTILMYTCKIDSYNESIHDPAQVSGTVESVKITEGYLKEKVPAIQTAPDIDVFD